MAHDALAGRALTCSALKPQGLCPAGLAGIAYELALGGIDFIKDDHGLADQAYSPFAERVEACAGAVRRANRETGFRTHYSIDVYCWLWAVNARPMAGFR